MNHFSRRALTVLSAATLTLALGYGGAASLPDPLKNPSGFLPDYSLLQPVANAPEGTAIYSYKAPGIKRSDYPSVMISPVTFYQSPNIKNTPDVQMDSLQATIQAGVESAIRQHMTVTDKAGPGVAQLTVAITGAMVEPQKLKPRNLLPISAVITLASKATDKDQKTPALMVELKFVDSVTHKLLRETVTVIQGEKFRDKSATDGAFQTLAQEWVQDALEYSAMQKSS